MLETDPQILLVYKSPKQITATLKLSNPIPNMVISFKIKTTTPTLFNVNPSKGYIAASTIKEIDIIVVGQHTKEETKTISIKEKFQIQYIIISDRLKQEQLEAKWIQQQKAGSVKKHKLKLKYDYEGIRASDLTLSKEDIRSTMYGSAYSKTIEIDVQQQPEQLPNEKPVVNQPAKQQPKIKTPPIQSLPQKNTQKGDIKKTAFFIAILVIVFLSIKSIFTSKQTIAITPPPQSNNEVPQQQVAVTSE